jgi:hypothetical protein
VFFRYPVEKSKKAARLHGVGISKFGVLRIMQSKPADSPGSSRHLPNLGGSSLVQEEMAPSYTTRQRIYPTPVVMEQTLPALVQPVPCSDRPEQHAGIKVDKTNFSRPSGLRSQPPQEPDSCYVPTFNGPLLNEVMLKQEFGSRFVPPVQPSQADDIPPERQPRLADGTWPHYGRLPSTATGRLSLIQSPQLVIPEVSQPRAMMGTSMVQETPLAVEEQPPYAAAIQKTRAIPAKKTAWDLDEFGRTR